MKKIAIIQCAKIKDASCVGCLKCFKAASKKEGEFSRYDEDVQIVAMSGCGDCPGLIMPKAGILMEMSDYLNCEIDAIHLGTCLVKAVKTAACQIDLDKIKELLSSKFGKEVVIGSHNY